MASFIPLIAAAITTGAQAVGTSMSNAKQKKASKLKSKELERETAGALLSDIYNRGTELEAHKMQGRRKLGQRKTKASEESTDLVRRAFNI